MTYTAKNVFSLLLLCSISNSWAGTRLLYEKVGSFDEVGRCYSGAMDEGTQTMAVGCDSGIFRGPPEKLVRISIRCAKKKKVSRIRSLGDGAFVASTACGLFYFGADFSPERIVLDGDVGALAVVDRRRVVVDAAGELYLVNLQDRIAQKIGRWPSSSRPMSIAMSRKGVISQGFSCRQGQAPWIRFAAPVHGARAALWDEEHVLWIGPWGRLWKDDFSSVLVPAGRLGFFAAERMRNTKALGRRRVWIRTDQRWFVLEEHGIVQGWLPEQEGPFIPLRSIHGSGPPILVGRGVLFKAMESKNTQATWCGLRLSAYSATVPMGKQDELEPELWQEFLPRISLDVGLGNRRWYKSIQGGYDELLENDFHAFVVLQWPLEPWVNNAQSRIESLRAALASRRLEKQQMVYELLTRLQLICHRAKGTKAQLELEQVLTELQILGIRATKTRDMEN